MKRRQKIILPALIGFIAIMLTGLTACSDNFLSEDNITSSSRANVSSSINPAIIGSPNLTGLQIISTPTSVKLVGNGQNNTLQPSLVVPDSSAKLTII